MKFKPWYVLMWAVLVGGVGSLSIINSGNWDETSLYGAILHIGVPIAIYLFLRHREKKKAYI